MKLVNTIAVATLYLSCFAQGARHGFEQGVRREPEACQSGGGQVTCKESNKCWQVSGPVDASVIDENNKKVCAVQAFGTSGSGVVHVLQDERGKNTCWERMDKWVKGCDGYCYAKTGVEIPCSTTCSKQRPYYTASNGKCYTVTEKKAGLAFKYVANNCYEKRPQYTAYEDQCFEKKPAWFYCASDQKCYGAKKACTGC
jgi:hypothetical protein